MVVLGLLGPTLDRGGRSRWSRWRPTVDLEQGLRQTVDWYLENEAWWRALETRAGVGERLGLGAGGAR